MRLSILLLTVLAFLVGCDVSQLKASHIQTIPMRDTLETLSFDNGILVATPTSKFSDDDCLKMAFDKVESINPTVLQCLSEGRRYLVYANKKVLMDRGEFYLSSLGKTIVTTKGRFLFTPDTRETNTTVIIPAFTSNISATSNFSDVFYSVKNKVYHTSKSGQHELIIELEQPLIGEFTIENISYNTNNKTIGIMAKKGGRGTKDLYFFEFEAFSKNTVIGQLLLEEDCYCSGEIIKSRKGGFDLVYRGPIRTYKHYYITQKNGDLNE